MVRKAKRRGLDPSKLPHAEKARIASEIVEFFTDAVPAFIARNSRALDRAWAEADLFNALAALPDRELKKRGLARVDLPLLVLSTFHLVRLAKRRKRKPARKAAKKKA